MKILVVEDNAMNLELMSDLLEASGYVVLSAQTAEEGLRVAAEQSPDLILMDVSLPDLDGLAATRQLKEHPATAHIPVIAVTAHAMKGDQERALAAGCIGYVTKPIHVGTFVGSLLACVAGTSR